MMKNTFFVILATLFLGCNDHSAGNYDDTNDNTGSSDPVTTNMTVGSDGEIALRTSEPGQDDFGPLTQSSNYEFEFSSGVAVFAATYEIDMWSDHNVEIWPVWDVAGFKSTLRATYNVDDIFSEQGMKAALSAFVCSEEVDEPDLAPLSCPHYYVSSDPFGYLDTAATFYWPIDSGQEGLVFVLKR